MCAYFRWCACHVRSLFFSSAYSFQILGMYILELPLLSTSCIWRYPKLSRYDVLMYGYFPTVLYTPLNLLPMVLSVYGGKSWVFHIPSNPAVDFQWTKAWGYLLSDWAYDGSRRGTISTTGRSRKTWVEPIFSLFGGVKADFFLRWHSSFLLCFLVGQGYTVTLFLMGGVDTV